jgi:hypothetical protein
MADTYTASNLPNINKYRHFSKVAFKLSTGETESSKGIPPRARATQTLICPP